MLPRGQEGVRSPAALRAALARTPPFLRATASAPGRLCAPPNRQDRRRKLRSRQIPHGFACAQTHRASQSHPNSPAPIAGNHRRPRSTFAVIAASHAHRQSPARIAARDRSAPHARRLRDGRARIRRSALYAGRAFEPRLFPDAKLHFTDHAGGHLVVARSRPGRKRRHVRHSARSRRRRLARACRSSRQWSPRCAWTRRASGAS